MRLTRLAAIIAAGVLTGCGLFKADKSTGPGDTFDGFTVLSTSGDDEGAAGATDGTNYLVAYSSGSSGIYTAGVRLISPTGVVTDPVPIGTNNSDLGAVAWDGSKYLAVVELGVAAGASDLYGQFVTAAGATSGSPIRITTSGNAPAVYSVTYGGGVYLVTYGRGEYDASVADSVLMSFARIVSTSGQVGPEITVGTRGAISASAFDGTNFLIIYNLNGTSAALHARVLNTAGTTINDVALSTPGVNVGTPMAVAWNGSTYAVAYGNRVTGDPNSNASVITVALVSSVPAVSGTPVTLSLNSSVADVQGIVATSSGFYVVWIERSDDGSCTTRAQAISAQGALVGSPVTLYAPDSHASSVAAFLLTPLNGKALALVNRKISGNWELAAEAIAVP